MIELPELYPHQENLRDRTRSALAKHGRVILTAPPGTGKTRCAKAILGASANREPSGNQSGKSLFTVHRRGLVVNATDSFYEEPRLPHGVIMSGIQPKLGHRVQVASIDTLLSWFVDGGEYPSDITFDLIVFDESHSHLPKLMKFLDGHDKRRKELGQHPAFVIGLTATPQAKGLADVYREIVQGPSTQWLIENGFLSPFRYFRATTGQMDLLKKSSTGDFTNASEAAAMDGLAGDLVRDWKKYAEGRPTVGFFPRRSHAQEAMEELRAAGLRVEYVDGQTPDETRKRIFWELNEHRLDYICNVQVIERGTDIPRIGCVQLCVAIGSLVRYCLDEDTEILTPNGWMGIDDKIEECYQVDEELNCNKSTIQGRVERVSNEEMWGIDGRSLDIRVTERHRMLIDRRRSGIEVCESHEMPSEFKIPVSCFEDAEGVPLTDDEIRFVGLVATDGTINSKNWAITISQSERHPECIEYIERVLKNCQMRYGVFHHKFLGENATPYKERHPRRQYTISFGDPVAKSEKHLTGWSRLIPWVSKNVGESMADVNREQLLVLLEAMRVGDGDKYKSPSIDWTPKTWRLAINDLGAAESLQSLCVRRGIRCNLTDNGCGCICLLIDPTRQWWSVSSNPSDDRPRWKERSFSGGRRVWCVEVPTGFIIARRNGKPFIVGNCQMIGRGSRIHPEKTDCLVLDHGGNVQRHGFFEDEQQWTLDVSTKDAGEQGTRPTIECPQCSAIYRGGRCNTCGYEPTPKERKSQGLEFDGSELKEVKPTDKKKNLPTPEKLMNDCLFRCGRSRKTWRQCYALFKKECSRHGVVYEVPSALEIAGKTYSMLRAYDVLDHGRYVEDLFPVTNGGGHGGKYLND